MADSCGSGELIQFYPCVVKTGGIKKSRQAMQAAYFTGEICLG
jgi:hypothetical protein